MKIFTRGLVAIAVFLLLWVNLPVSIPYNFTIGVRTFTGEITRPTFVQTIDGRQLVRDFSLKLGLDLQGGSSLIFQADTSGLAKADVNDALDSARDIIERRVNMFGVSEPSIRTIRSGESYRIAVDLPGVADPVEAISLIGSTAQLTFQEIATPEATIATDEANLATASARMPTFIETGLSGKDVKKASVTFNSETGEPEVLLEFKEEGRKKFAEISKRNVGRQVAILLDDEVLSAPVVQTPILDGNAVISGNFTTDSAKQFAIAINSGALPVPVKLLERRNVGPTLGAVEVRQSLIAGIAGLLMVMLFMVAYYGRLGLIACVALLFYGLITLAIFRAIPIVLTLPGIAGFILSIGMAVDSNILIFERIKEEIRKGRDFRQAIRLGFGRAMDAIKDANVTTLLVAFILFNPLNWDFLPQFGLVRGFALTLAIGVVTSLFTGIIITRKLIQFFYRSS
ncbi:MAG: protein translocase subunit SecD [Patescibacteria group bacterium]|nr:protein translocase subunit SecD [Patescibacteria group bacterium]